MVALVGAAILGAPTQAHAAFQLKITTTSGFSTTVTDGGGGDSLAGTPGAILFAGAAGANFTITVTTAMSKPASGSAASPEMDLNFVVNNTTGTVDTITISASDTDFGPLASSGSFPMTIGGTLASGGTLTYQTFQDTNNLDFGSTSSSPVLTFTTSPYSGTSALPVTADTNYSLTQTVSIKSGLGTTSGDATLSGVPAPAGLVLALTGMPVLGAGAWLRRRRVPAAV